MKNGNEPAHAAGSLKRTIDFRGLAAASGGYTMAQSSGQFLATMRPPEYVLDGILQRGMLYAMTGATGHGKTAISLLLTSCLGRGATFAARRTQRGSVLYLACENPENVQWQWHGVKVHPSNVFFHEGWFSLSKSHDAIREDAKRMPDLALVVVDTMQSLFEGDSDNDNMAMVEMAHELRKLTRLPGRPTVLVQCHPIKNPTRDNMVPRGGSAFLNEVDGNLAVWTTRDVATVYSCGKHRGAPYEPLNFKMEVIYPDLDDQWGMPMACTVAKPISPEKAYDLEHAEEDRQIRALRALNADPGLSQQQLGDIIGTDRSAAQRVISKLADDKLIVKSGRTIAGLTKTGKRLIRV